MTIMKIIRLFLFLFCFGVLPFSSGAAQTRRIIKNPKSKTNVEIWKPNNEGCRAKYAAGYKRPGPTDVVSSIMYMYNGILGRNSVVAVEYSCPPVIESVTLNRTEIITCSQINISQSNFCSNESQLIEVSTNATDPDGDILLYDYDVSGGKIIGSGSKVIWDLSGMKSGIYAINVLVDDGCGVCIEPTKKEIKVSECKNCNGETEKSLPKICPQGILINPNQEKVKVGETIIFTVSVESWNNIDADKFVFNWSISGGEIVSGQKTKTLTVRVPPDFTEQTISATVSSEDESCLHNPPSATVEIIKPR